MCKYSREKKLDADIKTPTPQNMVHGFGAGSDCCQTWIIRTLDARIRKKLVAQRRRHARACKGI